jgi:hypothetical protein
VKPRLLAVVMLVLLVAGCDFFNSHPTSRYATPAEALDVAARNDTLFVAQGDSCLQLFDISSPKSPKSLGRVGVFGRCACLALGASAVYVGTEGDANGYHLPDGVMFRLEPQGDSQTVYALLEDSTRLFMAAADGISLFDVTGPGVPIPAGFVPLDGHPTGLARHDSRLFVSLRDWGVRVFNILAGDSFVLDTVHLGKRNRAEGVTLSGGGYCIISQADSGVVVYYSPSPDTVEPSGGGGGSNLATYATAASDGVEKVSIYAADSSAVTICNIIRKPDGKRSFSSEHGFAKFEGFTRRICRGGNGYVYTASGDAGVYIVRE